MKFIALTATDHGEPYEMRDTFEFEADSLADAKREAKRIVRLEYRSGSKLLTVEETA